MFKNILNNTEIENNNISSSYKHLISGAIAGAVRKTFTAPLDRIKIFLQTQPQKQSTINCFRTLIREGGVQSLWRGNGVDVLEVIPKSAIKFATYDYFKKIIKSGNNTDELTIFEKFLAGSMSGIVCQSSYPFEVLKTRISLSKTGEYNSIKDAAVKIFRAEGIRAFYRGFVPDLVCTIPYSGIDLAVYETLKQNFSKINKNNEHLSVPLIISSACLSTTIAQVTLYPIALIRTRMQAHGKWSSGDKNQTMRGIFKSIIQNYGVLGLYRGMFPNFLKVLPAVSINYVTYEYFNKLLDIRMR